MRIPHQLAQLQASGVRKAIEASIAALPAREDVHQAGKEVIDYLDGASADADEVGWLSSLFGWLWTPRKP